MSVLLFKLRNVPEDEANDIREILESNKLDYYETSGGNWGISTAAIWLKNKDELERAKKLIDSYQHDRSTNQRQTYLNLKDSGKHKTIVDTFKENPFRFIAYILFVLVILYFSTKPFISLGS